MAQAEVAELLDAGLDTNINESEFEENGALNNLMNAAIDRRIGELKGEIKDEDKGIFERSVTMQLGKTIALTRKSKNLSPKMYGHLTAGSTGQRGNNTHY